MKVKPMLSIERLDAPTLPTDPKSHALLYPENLVVLHEVELPRDQLRRMVNIPPTPPADARPITDLRVAEDGHVVGRLYADAEHVNVESIRRVAEQPRRPSRPRPKPPVSRPSGAVAFVPVATVVGGLKPPQPMRQPPV